MDDIKDVMIKCGCGCDVLFNMYDRYGRSRKFINGHNRRKYDDPTQYKREWNHRNRKARYEYKMKYHRRRKVKMLHHFGAKCLQCGIIYDGKNACIFHFHHRDISQKLFNIGNQVVNKAWDTLITEGEKCDLLCANCHEKNIAESFSLFVGLS